MDGDESDGTKKWPFWAILLIIALSSPPFIILRLLGNPGAGRTAWICLGMLLVCIKVRWELAKYSWFWMLVAALFAVHVPFILFIHWANQWISAVLLGPIGGIDLILILYVFSFGERIFGKSTQ